MTPASTPWPTSGPTRACAWSVATSSSWPTATARSSGRPSPRRRRSSIASTTPKISADTRLQRRRALVDQGAEASAPELVIWHRDAGTQLAYEVEVRGTDDGEVSWQKVWVDADSGEVLESREQIAHGSGTAAYSGPNPLSIATTAARAAATHDRPDGDHAALPGRGQQHHLLGHRRRLGQRQRHQPRDRLRRRASTPPSR